MPTAEQLLLNEVQLLLAEKRTYFALLRTGIAVFSLPLSVMVFLIGTSRYHNLFQTTWVAMLVVMGLIIISVIGLFVTHYGNLKIKRLNELIDQIKGENKRLAEIVI